MGGDARRRYVEFSGRTAWAQRSDDALPRHQPRLAGERPRAGRHHDGVRRADRRDRRSAAAASSTATCSARSREPRIEGHFIGDRHARLGRALGSRRRRPGDREQLRRHHEERIIEEGDSTIDAEGRFSLGYPRKDNGEEINAVIRLSQAAAGRSAPRVRARRLSGRRPRLGRVSTSTAST